jgi:hypothetical protein
MCQELNKFDTKLTVLIRSELMNWTEKENEKYQS